VELKLDRHRGQESRHQSRQEKQQSARAQVERELVQEAELSVSPICRIAVTRHKHNLSITNAFPSSRRPITLQKEAPLQTRHVSIEGNPQISKKYRPPHAQVTVLKTRKFAPISQCTRNTDSI